MTLPIVSNSSQAVLWGTRLRSSLSLGWLGGVDDDNTLAESGVYNSYHTLRDAGSSVFLSLNADASNIDAAAAAFEQADAASAARF